MSLTRRRFLRYLWYGGPLLIGIGLLLLSGAEGARYEVTWRFLQGCLSVLCPEHAPLIGKDGVQVGVTMYQINGAFRRLSHVAAYALLSFLIVRAIQKGDPNLKPASLHVPLTLGLLLTIADELHRATQPNRHAKWLDLILNGTGILLTLLFTVLFFAIKRIERTMEEDTRNAETSPALAVSNKQETPACASMTDSVSSPKG